MRVMDAYMVKDVLLKIKNKDSYVMEAIAHLDREIAIRERQTKAAKDNRESEYVSF